MLYGLTITPIAYRQYTTDCHQQAAQPDPANQGLVINPHTPGATFELLTKRTVEITEKCFIN